MIFNCLVEPNNILLELLVFFFRTHKRAQLLRNNIYEDTKQRMPTVFCARQIEIGIVRYHLCCWSHFVWIYYWIVIVAVYYAFYVWSRQSQITWEAYVPTNKQQTHNWEDDLVIQCSILLLHILMFLDEISLLS